MYAQYKQLAHLDDYFGLPPGTYVKARWRIIPLQDFEGEVPDFVLSKALEIKERMPEAQFEVEELGVALAIFPATLVGGGAKVTYDLLLFRSFPALRPPNP